MTSTSMFARVRLPRASAVMLACSALLLATACDDDDDAVVQPASTRTVAVTPGNASVAIGGTQQLAAELRDASGTAIGGGTVVWSSADTTIATVSSTGLVTLRSLGSTAIKAQIDSYSGFAAVTAIAAVNGVQFRSSPGPLPQGQSIQLDYTAIDSRGAPIAGAVTLTSSNPTVATVSATGLVTGIAPGTATITGTSEGRTGAVSITVIPPPPVATIALSPSPFLVVLNGTQQLTATLRDVAGNLLTGRSIAYASSNPAIASVSSSGLVTVLANGQATITATSESRTGTLVVGNVLTPGTTYNIAALRGVNADYYLTVPAGTASFTVTTSGSTASTNDPDLEVYAPGASGAQVCSSGATGAVESCTVTTNGVSGLFRIRIVAFTDYSATTLRATIP